MSKEDKQAQVRSKLFPVEIIKINGVTIEMTPLRHGLVCEAIDFLWGAFGKLQEGDLDREYLVDAAGTLNRYLNECVKIPDAPDMQIEDWPEPQIPVIVGAFLIQTLQPKNWKTLAQNLQKDFGISLGQGL